MVYVRDEESGMKKAPMFVPVHKTKWDAASRSVFSAVHAVNCCTTVSQFAGHGKVTSWKAFDYNSQLTGLRYEQLTNETVDNVEKCVCKVYDPSTVITNCECFCLIREKTQIGFLLHLMH